MPGSPNLHYRERYQDQGYPVDLAPQVSEKAHRTPRIYLRATSCPTEHLRDEVLESWRRDSMVGLIHARVSVQPVVDHDPVDKVIDNGGDVVYAT